MGMDLPFCVITYTGRHPQMLSPPPIVTSINASSSIATLQRQQQQDQDRKPNQLFVKKMHRNAVGISFSNGTRNPPTPPASTMIMPPPERLTSATVGNTEKYNEHVCAMVVIPATPPPAPTLSPPLSPLRPQHRTVASAPSTQQHLPHATPPQKLIPNSSSTAPNVLTTAPSVRAILIAWLNLKRLFDL
ncbi:hypothetical protein BC829DRAFT_493325 [Chytridium lagenaria]|nr:hypothetical protein BC829DRAFT_493325 [Chytridium lagenaria]